MSSEPKEHSASSLPLVSITIQSYNHASFVEQAIRSACEQSYPNTEVIVTDDGSTDDSVSVIKALQDEYEFTFYPQENRGLVPTLNQLLQTIRGKYVVFLASDDFLPSDKLERQIPFLENYEKVAAGVGNATAVDEQGGLLARRNQVHEQSLPEQLTFDDIFMGRYAPATASAIYRVQALRAIGGFDERFFVEDFWSWLALLHHGYEIRYQPETLAFYRVHHGNTHRSSERMMQQILAILADYIDHPLYEQALKRWKAAYFSEMAGWDRSAAFQHFAECASWHPSFLKGVMKLFLPTGLWTKWQVR